jgi:hypothetical protein
VKWSSIDFQVTEIPAARQVEPTFVEVKVKGSGQECPLHTIKVRSRGPPRGNRYRWECLLLS